MRVCVGKPTIIGSDKGLSRGQHRGIIWIWIYEMLIEIHLFSVKKMHLEMSFDILSRPQRVKTSVVAC